MKAENCKTKLTSELVQGNVDLNYNNSNKKSYILILSLFSLFFIVIFILSYTSLFKGEKQLRVLSKDTETPEIIISDDKTKDNWIDTIFKINDITYNTRLLCLNENDLDVKDIDVYIDGKLTLVNRTSSIDPQLVYKFNKRGVYNIKFNIKKELTTMTWLFANNHDIVSATFLPGFDYSSQVTSMENMFVSTNIQYLDMRHLDTSNLRNLQGFININNYNYNFKTKNIMDFPMIDLSSFDTSKVTNCVGMLHELHNEVLIKISNKFTKCREQIPYFNRVINIDNEACHHYFRNCKKCSGSHETLRCNECMEGYRLMKNGHCRKIENYFTAIYDVKSTTEPVSILNLDQKYMTISDFNMYINGKPAIPVLK